LAPKTRHTPRATIGLLLIKSKNNRGIIMLSLKTYAKLFLFLATIVILLGGCSNPTEPGPPVELPKRGDKIPSDAVKITPDMENFPPVLHSDLWQEPVPMEG
jgi:hypothetical protein